MKCIVNSSYPLLALILIASPVWTFEIQGNLNLEQRHYVSAKEQQSEQYEATLSFAPELYYNHNDIEVNIKPNARINSMDDEKSGFYFKELNLAYTSNAHEFKVGINQVFWGVTESQHIIDIINQTDTLASVDFEQKMGQPMLQYTYYSEDSSLQVFLLPHFQKPKYASKKGRLRPILVVDPSLVQFESSKGKNRQDFALKYSSRLAGIDYSLHYFNGIQRTPILQYSAAHNALAPLHPNMEQVGIESQLVYENWLFKLEGYHRHSTHNYSAVTAGFEYTLIGVFDSFWDINLISEYQYDSRQDPSLAQGQNDLFLGARLTLNDLDGTTALVGLVQDLDDKDTVSGRLEISSRINDSWRWRVEGWLFQADSVDEITFFARKDDFLQFSIEYYF
ncbi:hypothetical protein PSECIP111854_00978 [Pseudoalteromonas sp. CIP111854]|uniref:Uncharacterized protein n=1 Tax=Pseudoalteromonas holothuriae TaxID=2963714 RepID=A0A9W4QTU1_9GAMM|nr:hypothetical protein [Pseudoalteromonas sp. CIP111854]CAH9052479.1 hypothetical protein PSECIP111854_00978 [Pseudoalteromonas sp. CIP111854]